MIFRPTQPYARILLGVFGIAVVAGVAVFITKSSGNKDIQADLSDKNPSVEELQQEMSRIAQYEFEHGCVEKNERGQDVFCGESKRRVDAAEARYQAAVKASTMPTGAVLQADTNSIQKFMGDSAFAVEYSRSQSPANFTVGTITKLSSQGDEKIETPDAWKRTVNIYRSTKEIEGTCQIYEFEVYPKTHDIVEVRVVYPDSYQGKCMKGDLFSPQISEASIKKVGEEYLKRIGDNQSFKVTLIGTSRWEWKWQDTDYQLPQGMAGRSAVDSKPTVRLYISTAGKLLQYNNTIPLFEN